MILDTIHRAQQLCPNRSLNAILADLGLASATYFRWCERAATERLADRRGAPHRPAVPPTPGEVQTVVSFARDQPLLGYKRLAYALMGENQAFLRPWMVHDILAGASLLGRRQPPPERLTRPPEADHPDQRWHTDLMAWWFDGQWFWLVDILDAWSRFLVHCELLMRVRMDDVILATQRALDTLPADRRRPGEPEIVHDGGPQFIGHEWRQFIRATGMTDVRTHPYHPQSNGRDERVHRTFREELPLAEEANWYQAQAVLADYRTYYNDHRPHTALHYLCPRDYYRGDPAAKLAAREAACRAAAVARQAYWNTHREEWQAGRVS